MWPFSPLLLLLLLVSPLADARWDPKISKCPPLPAHTTTTIRDLRPNTVGVVAALGDSITAGFGIEGILVRHFCIVAGPADLLSPRAPWRSTVARAGSSAATATR